MGNENPEREHPTNSTKPGFVLQDSTWLMGLEAFRDDLPEHLYSDSIPSEKQQQYSHTYFQGLLAEVGNIRATETWIPSQDKNQAFLDRTLADVRSLEHIPDFGYEEMVRRARTVDVIWFNDRRMPHSLLEVEFSTDIQNSLHKFLDLQDYYANFVIVADETRKDQFEKRVSQTGFDRIRDRVDFLNFEEVSTLHSATDEANDLVQRLAE